MCWLEIGSPLSASLVRRGVLKFHWDSIEIPLASLPAGVVMGLAWTALGGSTLYVEAASVEKGEGKGRLNATGGRAGICCQILMISSVWLWRRRGRARAGSMQQVGRLGRAGICFQVLNFLSMCHRG